MKGRSSQGSLSGFRFVETASARLRVREQGQGEPAVVFAADPPNVIDHYDGLFEAFEGFGGGARVVAFELPGFGMSRFKRGGSTRLTVSAHALAVRELLAELEARPAVLVFPCVTGYIAMRVAVDDPGIVAGLVLPQVASFEDTMRWLDRVDSKRMLRTPGLGQFINAVFRRRITRLWYERALADKEDAPRFWGPALAAQRVGAAFPLASAFQRLEKEPPARDIQVPALAVWGDRDRSHRGTDPDALVAHVPGARFHRTQCGHFPELEDPEGFVRLLRQWRKEPE